MILCLCLYHGRLRLPAFRVILNEVGKSSTSMGGGGGINEGSFGLRESLKVGLI